MKILVQLLTMWILLVVSATVGAVLARRGLPVMFLGFALLLVTLALFIKGKEAPIAFLIYLSFTVIGSGIGGVLLGDWKDHRFYRFFDIHSSIGGIGLPLTFAVLMALPASDLFYDVRNNQIALIAQLRPGTLITLGVLEALIIAAVLYWLRSRALRFYAMLEIAVGTIGIVITLARMPLECLDTAYILACLSAIYVIVRGLDNLSRSSASLQPLANQQAIIKEGFE